MIAKRNEIVLSSLLKLGTRMFHGAVPENFTHQISALVEENIENDEDPNYEWFAAAIDMLLDGRRSDWTKIQSLDSPFQDIQSLLGDMEINGNGLGIEIDDDGICVSLGISSSPLHLVISRTGPQFRII